MMPTTVKPTPLMVIAGRATGEVVDVQPGSLLSYRLAPLLPHGERAFVAHVEIQIQHTQTGTHLESRWQISDSAVESADFIAGMEIGFGQSLDRLTAILTESPHSTHHETNHRTGSTT